MKRLSAIFEGRGPYGPLLMVVLSKPHGKADRGGIQERGWGREGQLHRQLRLELSLADTSWWMQLCETADEKIIASIISVPICLRGIPRRDSRVFLRRLCFRIRLHYIKPLNHTLCVMNFDFCTDKTINKSHLSVVYNRPASSRVGCMFPFCLMSVELLLFS